MITPQQIEASEQQAWENMFDIAPPSYREKHGMFYKRIAGATCIVFPKYPIIHFNMVIGLGFEECLSANILDEINELYENAGQPIYMIQYFDDDKPYKAALVFEQKGYRVAGGWERIVWMVQPVNPLKTSRNFIVKKVTREDVDTWVKFIIDLYHYPVSEWLKSFWGKKNWEHFVAYENDKMIAARSVFIGKENVAWSGEEAPVPIAMTKDLEPDRAIWRQIQQYCVENNVTHLAADIEYPAAERNTEVYKSYTDLGFEVLYLKSLQEALITVSSIFFASMPFL